MGKILAKKSKKKMRLTSNVQLSTFNGVTERAHGGRDMGTDTMFGNFAKAPFARLVFSIPTMLILGRPALGQGDTAKSH
jgi:hypothetical protein